MGFFDEVDKFVDDYRTAVDKSVADKNRQIYQNMCDKIIRNDFEKYQKIRQEMIARLKKLN